MSYIDNEDLIQAGWVEFGSISGRRGQNGHIALYGSPNCISPLTDTISQDMSLTTSRYCKITIDSAHSDGIYNGPCLYMFVTDNEKCLVQIETKNFRNCIDHGVVRIVEDNTDFSRLTSPSISKSVAVALESDQDPVYLYYWPLRGQEEDALSCTRYKFLEDNKDPVWDDLP